MSNRVKIFSACFVILVVLASFAFVSSSRKSAEATRQERRFYRQDQAMGREFAEAHIMDSDDTTRYQQISRGVAKTHAISDEDLDWMLSLMNKPADSAGTQQEEAFGTTQRKFLVLGTLELVKKSSSPQQTKAFAALLPILSGTDTLNKGEADSVVVAFNLTKAIPYLQEQLKDPSESVRRKAKAALKELGT